MQQHRFCEVYFLSGTVMSFTEVKGNTSDEIME